MRFRLSTRPQNPTKAPRADRTQVTTASRGPISLLRAPQTDAGNPATATTDEPIDLGADGVSDFSIAGRGAEAGSRSLSLAGGAVTPAPSDNVGMARQRGQATSGLRRGVIAGVVVAVAIVAAALLLRPTVDQGSPSLDAAAIPTSVESAPIPGTRAAAVAPTPNAEISVRLRLGADSSQGYRDTLRAAVEAAGYGGVEIRAMPFPVDRSRVQFYDPADRPAAEALSRALVPVTGAPLELRDLGPIAGPDEAGSIDAWLIAGPEEG